MKKFLRTLLPEFLLLRYHQFIAWLGALRYGFPARQLYVIGVTGTKGKTSTSNFIWSVLYAGGLKAGMISTANIRINDQEVMNKYHMTMPGRWHIQRLMREMISSGCTHCVLETTSEGIKQYRHAGVKYRMAVFTNLTPEHLPSHGGNFDRYRETKGRMFRNVDYIFANADSEHAKYFLGFDAPHKITYGINALADIRAENIHEDEHGVSFSIGRENYKLGIRGAFNVYNALPAIAIGQELGLTTEGIKHGLTILDTIPGRMELLDEGQPFVTVVDYAHEKVSITYVLEAGNRMKAPGGKTIILLGAEGGGRDKTKRPIMGELAAKMADVLVVSNVDPYDDDPTPIVEDIAVAAEKFGMKRNENLFVIEDRREGIRRALSIAKKGDVVLITGKGAEQSIVINGISSPWDDRAVVREELRTLTQNRA